MWAAFSIFTMWFMALCVCICMCVSTCTENMKLNFIFCQHFAFSIAVATPAAAITAILRKYRRLFFYYCVYVFSTMLDGITLKFVNLLYVFVHAPKLEGSWRYGGNFKIGEGYVLIVERPYIQFTFLFMCVWWSYERNVHIDLYSTEMQWSAANIRIDEEKQETAQKTE